MYLLLALVVFVAATAGSDLVARTSIGGETLNYALNEHLYYAYVQAVGTILLLAPFVGIAVICAHFERHARIRIVIAIFAVAMIALLYFYFEGHQAERHAMLEKKWTAAALSIGLLPFFVGIPVTLVAMGAGALAARFDRRTAE